MIKTYQITKSIFLIKKAGFIKSEKKHVILNKTNLKKMVFILQNKYDEHTVFFILEKLKEIGFNLATKSGLSLGIDDLKSFSDKKKLIKETRIILNNNEEHFLLQNISPLEKSKYLITKWNDINNVIIQRIKKVFPKKEPLNPLALMAFSGARGNISQVSQLIGLRGLMTDPLGKLVEFPIQGNFREGMTLTEYFISCYGARKGLVDTALRTATAGYLTRRLVYVVQHIFISIEDCNVKNGISFEINEKSAHSLIGLTLLNNFYNKNIFIPKNTIISPNLVKQLLKSNTNLCNKKSIICRSILTCQLQHTLCQFCYGWDNARAKRVAIGEAIGIIAAQSIGEPGTQLTLRTFHTGGVGGFSGSNWISYKSPFEGFIKFKKPVIGNILRSWIVMPHNTSVNLAYKLTNSFNELNLTLFIFDKLKNELYNKTLKNEGLLFVREGEFIKKGQLLYSEININSKNSNLLKIYVPYYSLETGLIISSKSLLNKYLHPLWIFVFNIIKINLDSISSKKFTVSKNYSLLEKNDLIDLNTILFEVHFIKKSKKFNLKKQEYLFYKKLKSILCKSPYDYSTYQKFNVAFQQNNQKLNFFYKKKLNSSLVSNDFNMLWTTSSYYINILTRSNFNIILFEYLNLSLLIKNKYILWILVKTLKKKENFYFFKYTLSSNISVFKLNSKKNGLSIRKNKLFFYSKNYKKNKVSNILFGNSLFFKFPIKNINTFFYHLKEKTINNKKKITSSIQGEFIGFQLKNNIKFWYSILPNSLFSFKKYNKKNEYNFNFIRKNSNISGFLISNTINTFTIQKGIPLIFPSDTIYHKLEKDFIFKNELLCSFKSIKHETQDIIQGIPRIEKLLEGRPLTFYKPKVELFKIWQFFLKNLGVLKIQSSLFSIKKVDSKVYLNNFITNLNIGDICYLAYFHSKVNFGLDIASIISNVYLQEGVNISFKHIELIIRELTSLVEIINPGDSGFMVKEKIHWLLIYNYNKKLKLFNLKEISYMPIFLGMTEITKKKNSFGVAGSFQNLREIIINHTFTRKTDYLLGLHENVLFNKIIPAGTGFFF